jgi:hypothetical protein
MINLICNIDKFKSPFHKELRVIEQPDENTKIWYTRMRLPNMQADLESVMKIGIYR